METDNNYSVWTTDKTTDKEGERKIEIEIEIGGFQKEKTIYDIPKKVAICTG